MQSARKAAARLGARLMSGSARNSSTASAEARWAPYFPKPKPPTEAEAKKQLNKELLGFYLLGPAGAGFMFYDYVVGLEEEHEVVIPPYPWMRIRRNPGMPWGEDGLFEKHPKVATVWPPEEGLPEKGAAHHH